MAIYDLLWACPACGAVGGVGRQGVCRCGVTYRRVDGASIQARHPDGRIETRRPAEWLDRLPDPATLLAAGTESAGRKDSVRRVRVSAREATGWIEVKAGGRYLNRSERFGSPRDGELELAPHALVYRPAGGEERRWHLDDLTAVQLSSTTLQVKVRGEPIISFRLHDDSVLLWELLLQAALRDYYRQAGRGEITEFQPRIATR